MRVYLLGHYLVKWGTEELQELTEKRKKWEKPVDSIFLASERQNERKVTWSQVELLKVSQFSGS